MIVAPFVSLLILLGVVLSFRVIFVRRDEKILLGEGDSDKLIKRSRAFGNYSEYTPLIIAVWIIAELQETSGILLYLLAVTGLVGRALHAYSFYEGLEVSGHYRFRRLGMMLTFFTLAFGAIVVFIGSLGIF